MEFKQIHFHNQRKLDFGRNLYVVGNLPELQYWNPKMAIKMAWTENDHWRVSIPVRKDFEGIIEYKYIEADDNLRKIEWDEGLNQKLYISGSDQGSFTNLDTQNLLNYGRLGSGSLLYNQNVRSLSNMINDDIKTNRSPKGVNEKTYLKVMSFNICCIMDERWQKRGKLILQGIEQENAEFVGVQEVLPYQREYLKGNLNNYLYFGRPRSDDKNDIENGILFRKDRFYKIEGGNIWYSKNNGQPDYGASEPRMLTWAIFQDLHIQDRKVGIISTQFDDKSEESRQKSSQILHDMAMKFKNQCNMLVITGDFQVEETHKNLENLDLGGELLKSARLEYDPKIKDYQRGTFEDKIQTKFSTYHGFQGEQCAQLGSQQDHIFYVSFKQEYDLYGFRVLKNIKKAKKSNENHSYHIYPSSHYHVVAEFLILNEINSNNQVENRQKSNFSY